MSTSRTGGDAIVIPRRAWVVLALVSFGQMMTTFAGSALNVGFGVIEEDLGVERTTLVWAISGYAIAAAAFLLIAGRIADRIGGKRIFLSGMSLFTLGSLAAAVAPNAELLIAGRVVQGLGSAAMIPSSLSIALQEFPRERRSLAVGAWGGVAAIAGASGPPVGAALIELWSWRLVFIVVIPIGVAIVVVGSRILRDPPRTASSGRLDIISGPLASIAVGLVIVALLQSPIWGWDDPRVVGSLLMAPLLIGLLLWRSATHPTPLIDLSLFANRRFVLASATTTGYNAATAGYWLAAPLFLQSVWGWGVLASGLAIAPGPIVHLMLAGPTGRLADRGVHRELMIAGTFISALGTGGLALFVTEDSTYWLTVLPFTIAMGLGGAFAWPVFTSAALVDIEPEQLGEANGINLTMRQLGAATGVAVVIAVVGNGSNAGPDAFRLAWLIGTIGLLACTATLVWAFPRRSYVHATSTAPGS